MIRRGFLLDLLLLLAIAVFGCSDEAPPQLVREPTQPPAITEAAPTPSPARPVPAGVQARVLRVIDGDTIEVDRARDGRATVRYIGIDTPETVDPNRPVGCFGKEASDKNKQLVDGKTVYLEKDISETDRFGRLLRYVYVESGEMVNELLVRDGYAQVSTFPPDVKHQQRFLDAQRQARDANRGLWGAARRRRRRQRQRNRDQPFRRGALVLHRAGGAKQRLAQGEELRSVEDGR